MTPRQLADALMDDRFRWWRDDPDLVSAAALLSDTIDATEKRVYRDVLDLLRSESEYWVENRQDSPLVKKLHWIVARIEKELNR